MRVSSKEDKWRIKGLGTNVLRVKVDGMVS